MTDAGYVLAGWAVTGAALGGYLARVIVRARRAQRMIDTTPVSGEAGLGSPPTPR